MPILGTERLVVQIPGPADAEAVLGYYDRNREHLALSMPAPASDFYTVPYWEERLRRQQLQFAEGLSACFCILHRAELPRVIGMVNLTRIVRGPMQSCFLGYSVDSAEEGQGYVREALGAVIPFAFDVMRLHRIQAGYLPSNHRSGQVLESLGFQVEGHAHSYIYLGGEWRDHVLTALVNPAD